MSNLVHNERVKMMASFYNNLAVGSIISGAIAPMISGAVRGNGSLSTFAIVLLSSVSILSGFGFGHLFLSYGHQTLNNLREN